MNNGLILAPVVNLINPKHHHTDIPVYGHFIFDLLPRLSDADQNTYAV